MKKITKKLALNRETLRNLEDQALQDAAGGFPTDASCANSCDPYTARVCPSRNGCTTANC